MLVDLYIFGLYIANITEDITKIIVIENTKTYLPIFLKLPL